MTRPEIAKTLRRLIALTPELYWSDKAALELAAAEFDKSYYAPELVEELLLYAISEDVFDPWKWLTAIRDAAQRLRAAVK